jgi:hypothetical protein
MGNPFQTDNTGLKYEIIREGEDVTLRINAEHFDQIPSIEDNSFVMAKTVEFLAENKPVTKIVFYQQRDYEYDCIAVSEAGKGQDTFKLSYDGVYPGLYQRIQPEVF